MISIPAFAHVFVLHSFLYNRFAATLSALTASTDPPSTAQSASVKTRIPILFFKRFIVPLFLLFFMFFMFLFVLRRLARQKIFQSPPGVSRILRTT